ncbi:alcohol dehydrogenase catalytic domain-containing protein [Actinophytocola oryzae]|uniref:Threonine dehydrogenase-like Zn-dependent dehydrogenase n=1 Tax=Actinophytocola oryzae TaxID=502181 RepID=A0A4R7W3X4_9PSEU|nr:alcohol dehydrogenase catalytic domain-containing protein [Actinophytocola oryzae]TDV56307.1 threonine dehydrogenase-like Zn-dependent dehydrogenase [Actinophytocola oryzae]
MRVELGPAGPVLSHEPARRPPDGPAVLVRIELAGLCRSDLKEVTGARHGVSQFGHEIVGVVTESDVPGLPPGRRVGLDPNVPAVRRGSGFATEMWVAGPVERLVAALPVLPDGLSARRLVFAEPVACVRHCLSVLTMDLGRPLRDLRLAVLGAGTAGVLAAGLAHAGGASVVVGNRGGDRTEFLRERRVLEVPVGPLSELASDGVDAAVITTSFVRPEVLAEALRVVVPGGLVLLYGGTKPGDALAGLDCDLDTVRRTESAVSTRWCGKPVVVAGSYGTVPADFGAAVEALAGIALPVERMITCEVPLAELPGVLREQASGRFLGKTLVLP